MSTLNSSMQILFSVKTQNLVNALTALPVRGSTRRTLNRTYFARIHQHTDLCISSTTSISDFAYRLAQRPALPNRNLITFLHTERGRNVRGQVLVSFLVSGVLGDEVEVFATDDEGSMHFGGDDGAGEYTATDRDHAGERTFLIYHAPRQTHTYAR